MPTDIFVVEHTNADGSVSVVEARTIAQGKLLSPDADIYNRSRYRIVSVIDSREAETSALRNKIIGKLGNKELIKRAKAKIAKDEALTAEEAAALTSDARYRRRQYKRNVNPEIVANRPILFSTGTPFKVGTKRDSNLVAINNTVAKISGIPLTKKNKKVINQIYGDELYSAYNIVGDDFKYRLDRDEFERVRNVKKALRSKKTEPDGPTMRRANNLRHINIPGITNMWVPGPGPMPKAGKRRDSAASISVPSALMSAPGSIVSASDIFSDTASALSGPMSVKADSFFSDLSSVKSSKKSKKSSKKSKSTSSEEPLVRRRAKAEAAAGPAPLPAAIALTAAILGKDKKKKSKAAEAASARIIERMSKMM
jgi:hypothetical protein